MDVSMFVIIYKADLYSPVLCLNDKTIKGSLKQKKIKWN